MDEAHPPAIEAERRQRRLGRPVLRIARRTGERHIGALEGEPQGRALGEARPAAFHEELPVRGRPPQALAPGCPERDQRVDGAGMQPVRAEIDRMPAQRHGDSPAADPRPRLEHRDGETGREERPRRGDAGRARPDHHDVRRGGQRRQRRRENRSHPEPHRSPLPWPNRSAGRGPCTNPARPAMLAGPFTSRRHSLHSAGSGEEA
jgi:hypothetical protein